MRHRTWLLWLLLAALLAVTLWGVIAISPAHSATTPEPMAHRGTWQRPDNSTGGIRHAARLGVARVEIDVRETADGYFNAHHDRTLDRTTTCSGAIADWNAVPLRKCRLVEPRPWYRPQSARRDGVYGIPPASAVVATASAAGIDLLLDVKTGARNPRLLRIAGRADGIDVDLQVRDIADVAHLTARTSLDVGYCCRWPGDAGLEQLSDAGASHISIPIEEATRDRVTAAHEYGLAVHVWSYVAQPGLGLPDAYRNPDKASKRARGDVASWISDTAGQAGADAVHVDDMWWLLQ